MGLRQVTALDPHDRFRFESLLPDPPGSGFFLDGLRSVQGWQTHRDAMQLCHAVESLQGPIAGQQAVF